MEESSAFAPIVLFAYNRPEHTRQLLESLNRNPEAAESDLIVFCDGPKEGASAEMLERIKQDRETVRNTARCKNLTLHVSEKNRGLAPSVIAGMNVVFETYDRAIVLEDDLLLSEHFLRYMKTRWKSTGRIPRQPVSAAMWSRIGSHCRRPSSCGARTAGAGPHGNGRGRYLSRTGSGFLIGYWKAVRRIICALMAIMVTSPCCKTRLPEKTAPGLSAGWSQHTLPICTACIPTFRWH